ncbi:MAG: YneF family protein [Candidatus Caccosoma sp.]|nr:YneF family protein [Candidatus Caccosoma sp.]
MNNIIILAEISVWGQIGFIALGLVVGAIAGYFISRAVFKKQLKKNPPINEKMIRALYQQMGRKPSEAQVRAAMKAMNQYK